MAAKTTSKSKRSRLCGFRSEAFRIGERNVVARQQIDGFVGFLVGVGDHADVGIRLAGVLFPSRSKRQIALDLVEDGQSSRIVLGQVSLQPRIEVEDEIGAERSRLGHCQRIVGGSRATLLQLGIRQVPLELIKRSL